MMDVWKPGRRSLWICLVCGAMIIGAALGVFWAIAKFGAPDDLRILPSGNFAPRFRIAKETTGFTEPLDDEGYPDFEAFLNLRLGKGIEPKLNMVVGLLEALASHSEKNPDPGRFFRYLQMEPPPQKGDSFVSFEEFLKRNRVLTEEQKQEIRDKEWSPSRSRPWKSTSFPMVALWLKGNEKAMQEIARASRLPQFYFPYIDPFRGKNRDHLPGPASPGLFWFSEIISGFVCRAWLKTGEGDFAGASEDFLIGHRIVSHFKLRDLVDLHCYLAMEWLVVYAERSFLEFAQLSNEQWILWIKEIDALPKQENLADFLDWSQRSEILQEASRFNRFGNRYVDHIRFISSFREKSEQIVLAKMSEGQSLDWNGCLREIHRGMDRVIAAHRLTDPWDREKTLKTISEDWQTILEAQAEGLDLGSRRDRAKLLGQLLAYFLLKMNAGFNYRIQEKIVSNEELKTLFEIALALTMYRRDKGQYPERLEDLTPAYFEVVPTDLFSGEAHRYRKTPDGYLLYSVGLNRIDDSGGETLLGDPPGDDLCVRVPRLP